MARPGISKLGLPPKKYRPDRRTTRKDGIINFEKAKPSKKEDALRIQRVTLMAEQYPDFVDADDARKLIRRLRWAAGHDERGNTPASSVYMRDQRLRIVGWLWSLQDDPVNAPLTTAHILPTSWIVPAEDLMLVNPEELLECFRADLNRCGAAKADGFLFAALHGDYGSCDGCFHLHLHCVASRGMIAVLEKLREIERARLRKMPNSNRKRPPVRIDSYPLYNLPEPLSYCCKSYWHMKDYADSTSGALKRGKGRRISEPWHSIYLLWLDRWRLEQLTLMMKLTIRGGQLHVRK